MMSFSGTFGEVKLDLESELGLESELEFEELKLELGFEVELESDLESELEESEFCPVDDDDDDAIFDPFLAAFIAFFAAMVMMKGI